MKLKKLTSLLLAGALVFGSLAGCTQETENETGTTTENTGSETVETTAFPEETLKIGFVNYDTTAAEALTLVDYFDDLSQTFNIEMIYSESLASAEEEFAFIEQCAAAGADAIFGFYNEGGQDSAKLCSELGMYYFSSFGGDAAAYEEMKADEYYIGGLQYGENGNYSLGYAVGQGIVDSGKTKVILVTGGKDFGVQMFMDRTQGIMDAIDEANANGAGIEIVYEVPGWPGTEEYSAHQASALATDAEIVASTLTALTWIQPIQSAGKIGTVTLSSVDVVSETTLGLMEQGIYTTMASEPMSGYGMGIVKILNAVSGFDANQRDAEGNSLIINSDILSVDSLEEATFYYELEQKGGGWIWSADDMKTVLGNYNEDFTPEDIESLYQSVSVEDVTARK